MLNDGERRLDLGAKWGRPSVQKAQGWDFDVRRADAADALPIENGQYGYVVCLELHPCDCSGTEWAQNPRVTARIQADVRAAPDG